MALGCGPGGAGATEGARVAALLQQLLQVGVGIGVGVGVGVGLGAAAAAPAGASPYISLYLPISPCISQAHGVARIGVVARSALPLVGDSPVIVVAKLQV